MKETLLVIADDLTGANDTAVMFAEAGFKTILKTKVSALARTQSDKAQVISVSTDSRAIGERAKDKTQIAISNAIQNGIGQIYLKIDSTMRGSVKYQIEGAIEVWASLYPNVKAIICPAYPEMGRTIEAGHLYVNSVPVNETASGKDPICPVLSSSMQELLPDAQVIPCDTVDNLLSSIENSEYKQIVIDAKTPEDLSIIAHVINHIGNKIIPVGSAGLAQKLKNIQQQQPEQDLKLGRTLIVVTSIHETSQLQVDEYVSTLGGKSIVFNPSPSQLMNYSQSEHSLKLQLNALIRFSKDNVIIRANPAKVVNAKSANITETAKEISQHLADLSKFCLDNAKFDSLILFGGDGAAALLEQMNVTEMNVLYAVVPGVPLCSIEEGNYAGIIVMTKSGGFGDKTLLSHIMEK
ncbi:four-carbon acid sugar kinase family protein [Mannheimia varigena]|uniref:four-carbon acid sugar kinase family protein n=1 Tax=Mannheimia varigena TaxID=85404 RepID=UPI0011070E75|nr:four-carbon acid sugar kinase family protein [Mannheimia varigena]TLU74855.1 four-carbon acid sugar kinase family protein [Mannheimia varigena]